ncbi:hypothetical protein GCM10010252_73530 [Streptomyces aureoverticillatus]|nr:hypothetical protein GCM10010252_73530 [Streptomyces aureoverticillatus]
MAYAGTLVDWARSFLRLTVNTVSRPKDAKGFVILPRRWVVERLPAWLLHACRDVRGCEPPPEHSEAMLTLASITLMSRRLTRPAARPNAVAPRPAAAAQAA